MIAIPLARKNSWTITSDGTAHGTRIELNGVQVIARSIQFVADVDAGVTIIVDHSMHTAGPKKETA